MVNITGYLSQRFSNIGPYLKSVKERIVRSPYSREALISALFFCGEDRFGQNRGWREDNTLKLVIPCGTSRGAGLGCLLAGHPILFSIFYLIPTGVIMTNNLYYEHKRSANIQKGSDSKNLNLTQLNFKSSEKPMFTNSAGNGIEYLYTPPRLF